MEDQDPTGEEELEQEVIVGNKDQLIPFPQDWVGTWFGRVGGLGGSVGPCEVMIDVGDI